MQNDEYGKANILIVDDEPFVRKLLEEILSEKYCCQTADSAEKGLNLLQSENFQLVLADINLGGMSGIEMIPHVHNQSPDTVIMMISGEQTIERAIQAMRIGAFDYIGKPLDLGHIEVAVERALEHHSLLVAKRLHETKLEELVKQRTEELIYLSYHDPLTNLPNSILFEDRLSQALYQANRNKHRLAMLYLSIDRFNMVSDTLGPKHGYELLKEVAARLTESVGEEITIARFEGDEFAMLVSQIDSTDDIIELTNRIFENLEYPFVVDDSEIFISFSIGISLFPDDGKDEQTMLKNASAALARAKEKGGGNFQFYIPGINHQARKRLMLENNLRRAVENQEFEVYYQPKIDVWTEKIAGLEALVRWNHPEMGLISPAEFIPLAEETGLIIPIGNWVLRNACYQVKDWENKGFRTGRLSVNISARQFEQRDLVQIIKGIVDEVGLPPGSLELELTESSLMKNPQASIQTLSKLKEFGILVSIDDFGTGYSSLSYLQRLPIDILKIDQSFVSEITNNPDNVALVLAIIELAHNLRLQVIAEGVETAGQLDFLRDIGCDEFQGYYFSKPVNSESFERLFLMNHQSV
ncbi:MAG: EAL domain-containing protein [Pyrinomonadaceae bacterium]